MKDLHDYMGAGFHTVTAQTSIITYFLYKYPEEIPKLRAEITKVIKDDLSNLNKDTIEEFEYLVWFIKECQRMENSSSGTLNYRCF